MIKNIAENEGFKVKQDNNKYDLSIIINNVIYSLKIIINKDYLLLSTYTKFVHIQLCDLKKTLQDIKNKWKNQV